MWVRSATFMLCWAVYYQHGYNEQAGRRAVLNQQTARDKPSLWFWGNWPVLLRRQLTLSVCWMGISTFTIMLWSPFIFSLSRNMLLVEGFPSVIVSWIGISSFTLARIFLNKKFHHQLLVSYDLSVKHTGLLKAIKFVLAVFLHHDQNALSCVSVGLII